MPQGHIDESPGPQREVRIRTIVDGEIEQETGTLDQQNLESIGSDRLAWVDLVNPDAGTLGLLQETFAVHPLAIEDVFNTHHTPHARFFETSAHIVMHYPRPDGTAVGAEPVQAIIGDTFFITIHGPDALDTAQLVNQWEASPASWRSTSSSLLYATLRTVSFRFGPIVDHLNDALEELEREAISQRNDGAPSRQLLYRLFNVNEQIADVYNIASPFEQMMNSIDKNSEWFAHEHGNVYSMDVIVDAHHLANRLGMLRENAERLFEMVNTLITMQRTEVMKRLTLVATIFLPLSALSSYFGQNFQFMKDATASEADFLLWGVAVPIAGVGLIALAMWKAGGFLR